VKIPAAKAKLLKETKFMTGTKFRFFEFGEFRLDAHRRILQKNGETVHLTPRSFDLLCVLVENAGRILAHEELLEKVWEGTFVEQGNLKKTISALRQALGESPEKGEFITTIPRKGYRFTGEVRPFEAETILFRETKAEIIVEEFDDETAAANVPQSLAAGANNRFVQPFTIFLTAAAVFILGLVVFSVWHFSHKIQNNFSVENVRVTKVLSTDNIAGGIFSENGNYFAYSVFENEKRSLRVKHTATGSEVVIIQPMNASFWVPTFTPDGNYLYFYLSNRDEPSKNGVYRIPTLGGALQLISEKHYNGMKFSPDGTRLAVYHTFIEDGKERQELLTLNPDGNDERRIAVLPFYELFRGIAWSPDGLSLLCGIKKQAPFDEKAVNYAAEISLTGGAQRIVVPEQEALFSVQTWLPDKKSLLLREREPNSEIYQIWQYFPDSGEKLRVTKDDYSYDEVATTADGKTLGVIRHFGLTSIWTAETEKYDFRQIAGGGAHFYYLSWTADNRLVFSTVENAKELIGIMNADGTNKRLLTEGADGIRPSPEVSGDGKTIVFMSQRSGGRQVWQMDLEGRNLRKLTNTAAIGEAKLLSDGQTLIFTAYLKTATWSLMKQNADGQIVELSPFDTRDWDVSPDEKYLAVYAFDEQIKKNRLYVREIESGAIIKSFDVKNLRSLRWTRDGQALGYIRSGDFEEIILQPLDDMPERILTAVRGEEIRNFDWSRDGNRIAVVRSKSQNEAILIQAESGN
jgi:DNA-binding winged helix-turn-helix (wHTH) protein/Tol biopolymer transport system component